MQYADDTTLSFSATSNNELKELALEKTNSCVEYFKNLDLNTNFSKTFYINFGFNTGIRFQDNNIHNLTFNGVSLQETDHVKFLGIVVDKTLSWDHHVDLVCSKVSKGLFLLRKLSLHCSQDVLKLAYYGIIHPHCAGFFCRGGCPPLPSPPHIAIPWRR